MRRTILGVPVIALAAALAVPAAGATDQIAVYELDEGAGATTMRDSSGNGRNGAIGNEVVTGVAFGGGAVGYTFPRLRPNTPPAHPEHNVVVPHSAGLDPGAADYAVEVRYRTTNPFGNLIQKGQSTTPGGYWKIQLPQGEPSCLFRDGAGSTNAVRSPVRIDDGAWHTIRCAHTTGADGKVELFVDGAYVGRNRGAIGSISNGLPLSFGGKNDCDQVTTTCDYFGGDVDRVQITRPGSPSNQAPTAAFAAPDCTELRCTFDAAGSADPEGGPLTYGWRFGDDTTGTGRTVTHAFPDAGTYPVTLTVTDQAGATATTSRQVTVTRSAAPGIAFRAAASSTGNAARAGVTTPATVTAGDAVLLFLSTATATSADPGTGWTPVGSRGGVNGEPTARVWSRFATAADAGRPVAVTLGAQAKFDLTVAAYDGVAASAPVSRAASAAEDRFRTTHTTPAVPAVEGGDRLLSYWTDKSSSTDWAEPAGTTVRAEVIGTGAGRVNALLTESASGSGSLTATSGAASKKAVTWSLVLDQE